MCIDTLPAVRMAGILDIGIGKQGKCMRLGLNFVMTNNFCMIVVP